MWMVDWPSSILQCQRYPVHSRSNLAYCLSSGEEESKIVPSPKDMLDTHKLPKIFHRSETKPGFLVHAGTSETISDQMKYMKCWLRHRQHPYAGHQSNKHWCWANWCLHVNWFPRKTQAKTNKRWGEKENRAIENCGTTSQLQWSGFPFQNDTFNLLLWAKIKAPHSNIVPGRFWGALLIWIHQPQNMDPVIIQLSLGRG